MSLPWTRELHAELRAIIERTGPWLLDHPPGPLPMTCLPLVRVGLYVALSATDHVRYVGKVNRPGDLRGVASRFAEHRSRRPQVTAGWARYMVYALSPETPETIVIDLEGRLARRCGLPPDGQRSPRPNQVIH